MIYGCYALLEELGFAFLHPLAPAIPHVLNVQTAPINLTEAPRWYATCRIPSHAAQHCSCLCFLFHIQLNVFCTS
jgi:hypothetical protein